MSSDLDDLLGDPSPAAALPWKPKRGRPRKADKPVSVPEEVPPEPAAAAVDSLPHESMFYQPVGISFLSKVFRQDVKSMYGKLRHCPVYAYTTYRGKQVPQWDFVEAASYLVPPRIDLMAYLSSLNFNNIPPHLNKLFWDARIQKQKWERIAGQTWEDADVLEVLGDVAMTIKDAAQLWVENLPGKDTLTAKQYESLRQSVDGLLDDITTKLVRKPSERRTRNTLKQIDDLGVDNTTPLPDDLDTDLLG